MNNRLLLSLAVIAFLFVYAFIFTTPFYTPADDYYLRSVADGTFSPTKTPTEMLLWSTLFYGKILKFLYISFPTIYWYDIFTYLSMTVSFTIFIFSLHKRDDVFYNSVLLFILTPILLRIFISPQFTTTAGILFLAAVAIAIYILTNTVATLNCFLLSLAIYLLAIASSFLRFESHLAITPLAAIYMLFFVNKQNFKKACYVFTLCLISIASTYSIQELAKNEISKNEQFQQQIDVNELRLDLSQRTYIYDKPNHALLWSALENGSNLQEEYKDLNWNSSAYRVLLSFNNIGDKQFYSVENLTNVRTQLQKTLKSKKTLNLKFRVQDYHNHFKYYFAVILLLALLFYNKKTTITVLVTCAVFVLYVIVLSNFMKMLPERVWLNFTVLMLLVIFFYAKTVNSRKSIWDLMPSMKQTFFVDHNKDISKIITGLLLILTFFYSTTIPSKTTRMNNRAEDAYLSHQEYIAKHFNKDDVYIIDTHFAETQAIPFRTPLHKGFKFLTPLAECFGVNDQLLASYGIPLEHTSKYITGDNNVYYYAATEGHYSNFYIKIYKLALGKFMKENYDEEIAFIPTSKWGKYGENIYKIITLSPEQRKKAKELREEPYLNELFYLERASQ